MRSSVSRTECLALLLLTLLSPLSAAEYYSSNPLSQKTGDKDSLSGEGWELSVEGSKETLYMNGEVKEVKTFTSTGYNLTKDGITTEVTLDGEGRPVIFITDGEKTVNTYSETGHLLSTVVTRDDRVISIRKYFTSYDGTPVRTDGTDSVYIFSRDDFYYSIAEEEGWAIRKVGENLYVRDTADGTALPDITEDEKGVTLRVGEEDTVTFGGDGNISEETDAKGTTRYFYEEGALIKEERTEGDTVIMMLYENGILKSKETAIDGVISTVLRYLDDGHLEKDMYRKGKHYATVTYDRDGSTVLDVEML